ncbi:hypothetical protein [Streptomyces sp. NPDC005799]|uniref:hypothetical protein n=1 Tax=Streptomyces sp. NPDC005799 TaxID=3154678 RepID=UPI0033E0183D
MSELRIEDIAELRKDPDSFRDYLRHLTGRAVVAPVETSGPDDEPEPAAYHIPRKGAWPCGTAATGPTPAPCGNCQEGTAR